MDRSHRIVKALKWETIGNILTFVSFLASGVIIARHIEPEYIGLIAIYWGIIMTVKEFSKLGFEHALIQKNEHDEESYSTVFVLVIGLSILTTLIMFFGIDLYFDYKKTANYRIVFSLLSLIILIDNSTLIHRTKCIIDLDLQFINFVRILQVVIGATVAIILAFNGFILVALASQYFVYSMVGFFMFFLFKFWLPTKSVNFRKARLLFDFGSFVYAKSVLNSAYTSFHRSILGVNYSPDILAQMDKSRSFAIISNQFSIGYFNRLLFPLLSKSKNNSEQFHESYYYALKIVSIIGFFLTGLFVLIGPSIIEFLYGDNWTKSVAWTSIISFNIYVAPLSMVMGSALLSQGFSKPNFVLGLVLKIFPISALIASFYFSVEFILYMSLVFGIATILFNILVNVHFLKMPFVQHINQIKVAVLVMIISLLMAHILEIDVIATFIIYTLLYALLMIWLEKKFLLNIYQSIR